VRITECDQTGNALVLLGFQSQIVIITTFENRIPTQLGGPSCSPSIASTSPHIPYQPYQSRSSWRLEMSER
jgi:hypothetical protein